MRNLSQDEMVVWYFNAVKSVLILEKGLLPSEADFVLKEYGLQNNLRNFPDLQMHDDPRDVVRKINNMGLLSSVLYA